MPQGLQVWDKNGVLTVDLTDRLGLAIGSVNTGTSNGSIQVPQFQGNTPFYYALSLSDNAASSPRISITGTTLSWTFVDITINGEVAARVPSNIFFGVV